MSDHSLLSPSSAPRWMACPGSVFACKDLPESTSEYAEEGTQAHSCASSWLKTGQKPVSAAFRDKEMEQAVTRYVEKAKAMAKKADATWVEEPLDLSEVLGIDGEKGTADFIALVGRTLQVHDLKYGKGVVVEADGNWQLIEYGLGAIEVASLLADQIDNVMLVIHQPRISEDAGLVVYTAEEMVKFRQQLRKGARQAMDMYEGKVKPEYNPGEKQCRFCGARPTCEALRQQNLALVLDEVDVVADAATLEQGIKASIAKIPQQSEAVLAALYPNLELFSSWVSAVKEHMLAKAIEGTQYPGLKVVEGRAGARKWSAEDEVEKILKESMRLKIEQMYDLKLISPTQAEKVLTPVRFKKLQEYITRSEPKPCLVPESDKRPAMTVKPAIAEVENLDEKDPWN